MMSAATGDLASGLSHAFVNHNDPETVKEGTAAYLIMVDALLNRSPHNADLLRTAADLNAMYTGLFVEDSQRAQKLTDKALGYAQRAICLQFSSACHLRVVDFQEFEAIIGATGKTQVPYLFTLGSVWATWIQARRQDWNAVGEISRVETIMEKVLQLDESYQDGQAHLYLGVIASLLPAALGGTPVVGKHHFERAIALSGERNLMAKVLYARHYARLVFDRELHDALLQEVLEANPDVPGYVLVNTAAREEATQLLADADEYF